MKKNSPETRGFTLGRERFAKISAVEGLRLSEIARREFDQDEKKQIPFAQRRERILAKYARKND